LVKTSKQKMKSVNLPGVWSGMGYYSKEDASAGQGRQVVENKRDCPSR
jgi:hypothetical protein